MAPFRACLLLGLGVLRCSCPPNGKNLCFQELLGSYTDLLPEMQLLLSTSSPPGGLSVRGRPSQLQLERR